MIRSHGKIHNLDTIVSVQLFILDKHDEETARLHKKLDFGFILLLALGAIVDFHVEL
jgi:hypothetical protein